MIILSNLYHTPYPYALGFPPRPATTERQRPTYCNLLLSSLFPRMPIFSKPTFFFRMAILSNFYHTPYPYALFSPRPATTERHRPTYCNPLLSSLFPHMPIFSNLYREPYPYASEFPFLPATAARHMPTYRNPLWSSPSGCTIQAPARCAAAGYHHP